jgi:hypothetical protein
MLNGKARAMGLGPTHAMNVAEARGQAAECKKQLFQGKAIRRSNSTQRHHGVH